MIFAVSDLHLDQYWDWIKWYTKQKEGKITDLQAKIKLSLCQVILYTKWKSLTFRVDLWSQKVTRLRNGMSDFRKLTKLGIKISVRLQRKKSWSGAAESAAVLRALQNLSRGGGGGGLASAFSVKGIYDTFAKLLGVIKRNKLKYMIKMTSDHDNLNIEK